MIRTLVAMQLTLMRAGAVSLLSRADDIEIVAEVANGDEVVPVAQELLPDGADVIPAALSAGERQLIALARAHLSAAKLAILDEATCHLDPAAAERAERAFVDRPGTLIVIAHRMSSALRADRVLVLDGLRPQFGQHEALLASCPLYQDLIGQWHGDSLASSA